MELPVGFAASPAAVRLVAPELAAWRQPARAVAPKAGKHWRPSWAAAAAAVAAASASAGLRARRAARTQGTGRRRCRPAVARQAAAPSKAAPAASKQGGEPKVVLMGDSVLDNFFWLQTPKKHLRVRLEEQLKAARGKGAAAVKGLRCVNLAVDQMTTFDFELRKPETNPWSPFAKARAAVEWGDDQDSEYPVDDDGSIRSVKNLSKLGDVKWVVLSLGGNDVYLRKDIQAALIGSILPGSEGARAEVAEAFGKRLRGCVAAVKKAAKGANIVLVIPYQPHKEFSLLMGAPVNDEGDRISGDLLGDFMRGAEGGNLPKLVNPMVLEMLAVAREEKIPVIDLSKTLDPSCEEHYGTGKIGRSNSLGTFWSGAEPSDVSNGFIAQLIAHAMAQEPKAAVYRGVPRQEGAGWSLLVKEEPNDAILAQDYMFGSATAAQVKKEEEGSPLLAFGFGVALTALANAASLLAGGDALFFDRPAFETELQQQMAETEQVAPP